MSSTAFHPYLFKGYGEGHIYLGETQNTGAAYQIPAAQLPSTFELNEDILFSISTHVQGAATPTLQLGSIPAKQIVSPANRTLLDGEIPANTDLLLKYNSTYDAYVCTTRLLNTQTFSPTITASGSMTVSAVDPGSVFQYTIDGTQVHIQIETQFTLGGVADIIIIIPIPVNAGTFLQPLAVDGGSGSVRQPTVAYTQNVNQQIEILRSEGSVAFSLGAAFFRINGSYYIRNNY